MRRHKHWPESHPRYASAPWCDLPTKKACDQRYAQWKRDQKDIYEIAQAARREQERSSGEVAFERFLATEYRRIEDILRPRGGASSQQEVH